MLSRTITGLSLLLFCFLVFAFLGLEQGKGGDSSKKPQSLEQRIRKLESAVSKLKATTLPVGSIIPFYGDPASLPDSCWMLCDGQSAPENSELTERSDANVTLGGIQVPDLRDRFLKSLKAGKDGARYEAAKEDGEMVAGGRHDTPQYTSKHNHKWATFGPSFDWTLFLEDGKREKVVDWTNGFSSTGSEGIFALAKERGTGSAFNKDTTTHYHTEHHSLVHPAADNRPSYASVYFIIKVRNQ